MIEISDRDIADLNDTDLRSLVALLAETTLRGQGLSASAVTWGGDQNAPDGGLDVRVDLDVTTSITGFIPRPTTGYQVKKPDMSPSAIGSEMRPSGLLRESICRLADQGGAYIIASSGSNLSDSARARRIAAMRSAIADHPNFSNLVIDFFDRQRLATWVRDHPTLAPWVRQRVGCPMQGWRSYPDWGISRNGMLNEFLVDDAARLYAGTGRPGQPDAAISIVAGLGKMREVLRRPSSSLRLIGLSGVGKTRLVKALFDEHVGTEALDPGLAVYADLAHHPEPTPVALATHLLSRQARSIIIVDNCPSELHGQLTQLCRTLGSSVSLITVEYDIRDDTPEGTEVFRLEVASEEVVAKIVTACCPWLSQVDAQSIGVFSGGNARVGLALAHTTRAGDRLSGLSDEDLFSRLFRQRHDEDLGLQASAEACSLVYSFDGQTAEDGTEIARLAALANCAPTTLYRNVAELSRRGLLQERSRWRAVLPHAIANRLAAMALENIPATRIQQELVNGAPERLIKSFSRRLSYLHGSTKAVEVAEQWLSASGLLGAHVGNLNELGMTLLTNIAPVAPEASLAAIERASRAEGGADFFSAQNSRRDEYVRLLRKIAYDSQLFDRCANLLVLFARASEGSIRERGDGVVNVWQSLFSPFLSGTHASVSQRMRVLDKLLRSGCSRSHDLALGALGASLETFHFSSSYSFEFGARSRDYGYHPTTGREQIDWFSTCIQLATDIGTSAASSAPKVRALLAHYLPGLWVHTGTQELLASAIETFAENRFWEDGWMAVKEAIWRSRDCPQDTYRERLQSLESMLAPRTLLDEIQLYVVRDRTWIFETEDTPDAIGIAMRNADARAEQLGRDAVAHILVLEQVLPNLARQGNGYRWHFGRGLALEVSSLQGLWSTLIDAVTASGQDANPSLLMGYLSAWREREPDAARVALDEAIKNVDLLPWVPQLQAAMGLDGSSVKRLTRALVAGAPAWGFRILSLGRVTDTMPPPELAGLLSSLAAVPDGWAVAVDVLSMRLRSEVGDRTDFESLLTLGRTLLAGIEPRSKAHQRLNYDLATLASTCLVGAEGADGAVHVCRTLAENFGTHNLSFNEFHTFVGAIFRVQPFTALDAFLVPPADYAWRYPTILSMFDAVSSFHAHPLKDVADDVVLEWCAREPERNYTAAATSVPYCQAGSNGVLIWTNLATQILENAPDPIAVLEQFVARFEPHSWSGSRAAIIEANAGLLVLIDQSSSGDLASFARRERERLEEQVRQERGWEMTRSRRDDERFE